MGGSCTSSLPSDLPALPNGWDYSQLGDLVRDKGICYGIVQPGKETTSGTPIVRVNNIRGGRVDTSDVLRVAPDIEQKYTRSRLEGGEVLLTLVGTLGEVAIAPRALAGWNVARAVGVIPVNGEVSNQWVAICLRTATLQHYIRMWATTTVQATFNLRDVARLPIPIPPLDERRAIAHILGTLDEKIELNRRMNETLEGIARAVFQSWFVDFDPVRAKLDGRQPAGMDAETAKLFPDGFEDSELGKVPRGWGVRSVADIAGYVNGRNFTKNATGTGRVVIRIAELNSGIGGSTKYNDLEAKPDNIAYPDDILFAWSGSLDVYRWHGDEALVNQHIFKVVCDIYPKWFVYFQLCEAMPFFQSIASHKATTMGHIQRGHMNEAKLALPTHGAIEAAGSIVEPMYNRIHALHRESQTLSSLRDTLLPKLLSGEIRVGEALTATEEVPA